MDQIKELLEILKETPQMALWGIGMYFMFILIKAASWIGALTLVVKQFIKRHYNSIDKKLDQSEANQIIQMFENSKISSVSSAKLLELLGALKGGYGYIHESEINKAIKLIRDSNKS